MLHKEHIVSTVSEKKVLEPFFELSEASFVDLLEGNLDELVVVKLFLILDFL